MRADMAKVIVERPRKKGCAWHKPKGYQRRLRRYGEDGPPVRDGIKACWHGRTKYLNEHLGPLRRYLDKQVGRPWDKIFSEICENISRNNAVQDHVRDHVKDFVTTQVIEMDGVPCNGEGGWWFGRPLAQTRHRLYVCPRTGLLRRLEVPSRKRASRRAPRGPAPVRLDAQRQCHWVDGGWHLVTLAPLPLAQHLCRDRDVLLRRPVASLAPGELQRTYGGLVYATGKRRLGKKEIRQLPITLDPPR